MTNNIEVGTYDNTSGSTAGFIIKSNLLTVNGGKLKTKKKYRKQKSKRKKHFNKIRHKSYKQQHYKQNSRLRVKKNDQI